MKKKVNMMITIPMMLAVLALAVIFTCSGWFTFRSGIRIGFIGNDGIHKFSGSYTKITGTMSHSLKPSKDSTMIHCEVTTKSGTLHILITQKDDNKVVLDRKISDDETFDIPAEGVIKVKLSTEGHSGSYRFEY